MLVICQLKMLCRLDYPQNILGNKKCLIQSYRMRIEVVLPAMEMPTVVWVKTPCGLGGRSMFRRNILPRSSGLSRVVSCRIVS
jgi:hypothetical protein